MNASMTQGPNVADHRTHSPKGGGAKGRRCEVGSSPRKSWRLEGCVSKSKAGSPEKPLTFWRVGDPVSWAGEEGRGEEGRGEEEEERSGGNRHVRKNLNMNQTNTQ